MVIIKVLCPHKLQDGTWCDNIFETSVSDYELQHIENKSVNCTYCRKPILLNNQKYWKIVGGYRSPTKESSIIRPQAQQTVQRGTKRNKWSGKTKWRKDRRKQVAERQ